MIRLTTCENAEIECGEVIKTLKNKEFIFWGNNMACDCDYLFVHSKGSSTINAVLRVRNIQNREEISKEEFMSHRPIQWSKELEYSKYFIIDGAKKVFIPIEELLDGEGKPKNPKAMRDMVFVDWDKFESF